MSPPMPLYDCDGVLTRMTNSAEVHMQRSAAQNDYRRCDGGANMSMRQWRKPCRNICNFQLVGAIESVNPCWSYSTGTSVSVDRLGNCVCPCIDPV